jgi:hypothetical protein
MEFIIQKTIDLTEVEQVGILKLFNLVFGKERSLEIFRNQFLNNPLGYSFHSMIINNGEIIGCITYIPSFYNFKNRKMLFVLAVDAMVNKEFRGLLNFYKMIITGYEYMKQEGVNFVYAFPNNYAYPVYIKSKLMKEIGKLNTYCLPYRIGGIKPVLKALNWPSMVFVRLYLFLLSLFSDEKVYNFVLEKEAETYNATRYKRFDGNYNVVTHQGCKFAYKIMEYEGIRSAFLIDVFEKSAANFNKAIRYIIRSHHKESDILLYVGKLPFRLHGLLRIPKKLEPKKFHFIGEILRKDEIDKDLFFNINNWDVNLSNYDLL